VVTYFLIGMLTGIPIGPVNVAVIDAAFRHTMGRAFAVGFGGAVADGLYAAAGILGVGPWLSTHASVSAGLYVVSGFALLIYGVLTARTQPVPAATVEMPRSQTPGNEIWSGFRLGMLLILLNPAALLTWVVIIGKHLADATRAEGLGAAVGVFFGSLAWFTLVAWLTHRGKFMMGDKAVWIPRVVGVLLIGYGLYSLGKGCWLTYGLIYSSPIPLPTAAAP
jgi:threonine/homoserine/homoserine lactone efflux protein